MRNAAAHFSEENECGREGEKDGRDEEQTCQHKKNSRRGKREAKLAPLHAINIKIISIWMTCTIL